MLKGPVIEHVGSDKLKERHVIGVQNGKESVVRNETETTIIRCHFIHSFGTMLKVLCRTWSLLAVFK